MSLFSLMTVSCAYDCADLWFFIIVNIVFMLCGAKVSLTWFILLCYYLQVAMKNSVCPQLLPHGDRLLCSYTKYLFRLVSPNKLRFNGNSSDLRSGSGRLEFSQGYHIFWLSRLRFSSVPSRKPEGSTSDRQQPFPSNPFPVFYSSDIFRLHV